MSPWGCWALVNLIALLFLVKLGLRILRDFDRQIGEGIEQPVFDASQFRDMNVDPVAWEIEPEDLERIKARETVSGKVAR